MKNTTEKKSAKDVEYEPSRIRGKLEENGSSGSAKEGVSRRGKGPVDSSADLR